MVTSTGRKAESYVYIGPKYKMMVFLGLDRVMIEKTSLGTYLKLVWDTYCSREKEVLSCTVINSAILHTVLLLTLRGTIVNRTKYC